MWTRKLKSMNQVVEIEKIVTSKQVAKIMKVTQRTVCNWVKTKNLVPIVILENGGCLFNLDDLRNIKLHVNKSI